ncbi:MAG: pilus assembly protein PilM [Solirubrobacterales bacterium]
MFSSKKKTDSIVGVDLDSDSVAAAAPSGMSGVATAVEQLPVGAFGGGEVLDVDAVSGALRELFDRSNLPKRVRLSVASQGVAFRTVRLPLIEDQEQLKAAVRFQAQETIPMPLDSAVMDHQVIGAEIGEDGSRQIDVAVVAARRQSVDTLLAAARGAGLDPVGVDLAAFGMIRALAGTVGPTPTRSEEGAEEYATATLYASLGGVTNLAIARDFACLFSRVAQFSVRGIAEELASATEMPIEHAEQWLVHTGFETPVGELEGDPSALAAARRALEQNIGRLADELRLSLDYYGAQEGAAPVGDVVITGWGSAIPGIAAALGVQLAREVTVRRPAVLGGLRDSEAARLTLPYGLALEH